MNPVFIERAVFDFEKAKRALHTSSVNPSLVDHIAASLVVAARLESLERELRTPTPEETGDGR